MACFLAIYDFTDFETLIDAFRSRNLFGLNLTQINHYVACNYVTLNSVFRAMHLQLSVLVANLSFFRNRNGGKTGFRLGLNGPY